MLADYGWTFAWMAFVVIIARPFFNIMHDLLVQQSLAPSFTNLVRWQTHRYVLRQTVGFFTNDFAGRIASKIIQTGPALRESVVQVCDALWFVTIYSISSLVLFGQLDPWLMLPLGLWIAGFVLRALLLRAAHPRALGGRVGGALDADRAHRRQLHQHPDGQAVRAHLARGRLRPRRGQRPPEEVPALDPHDHRHVLDGGDHERPAHRRHGGARGDAVGARRPVAWRAHHRRRTGVPRRHHVGLDHVDLDRHLRQRRRRAGGHGDHRAPAGPRRQAATRCELKVAKGEIRFENVTFHYGKKSGIIENLSLTIAPGEKVGLVGRSGAGKSTIANLLLRFYDVEGGRIVIDGQDIAQVSQDSLRSQIGLITQDTSLLHRSIRENVLYGRPEAGEEAMRDALRQAHAEQFVPNLSDYWGRQGYDAHVGERGAKLSGGQRQRVAIARVLLKDAPILVLDEATSALDSEVEAAIQESFYRLMKGKTVIAIAHRLSTIAAMDRLVVLDHGQIVEMGTHDDLIRQGGLYASLWNRQSGGFLDVERPVPGADAAPAFVDNQSRRRSRRPGR